ncbi:hypothetical protein FGG08_004416 [Glutinoglossum americanum]|uniref:Uncharacterized protein n=1 Tax=Glutinoglossum americanum TaxID=1670608 RepID=A0A9P8I5C8_9PEZI|nr:hypothetical protein FGG08_004416 [Glutinoglossum americanum]
MDWEPMRPLLESLTQDLRPVSTSPGELEDLRSAQLAIAQSVLTGQDAGSFGLTRSTADNTPHTSGDGTSLDNLMSSFTAPTGLQRTLRRIFATTLSPDPHIDIAIGGGQAPSATHGPFLDSFGQRVAIDVFTPIPYTPLRLDAADPPFMYISMPQTVINFQLATIGSGSVWIPASQFGGELDGYVGLKVKSGQLRYSIFLSDVNVTLELQEGINTAGTGGMVDGSAVTPGAVSFRFTRTEMVKFLSADPGEITAFGETVKLQQQQPPSYNIENGRLHFPFTPGKETFEITSSISDLATFTGAAPIAAASWVIPIAISATATFAEALGSGGISLTLGAGVSVLPLGRDSPITCGAGVVITSNSGTLGVAGDAATAPNLAQIVTVGQKKGGGGDSSSVRRSTLTFRNSAPFIFRFIEQENGNKAWSMTTELVASLDQPRTINGARVQYANRAAFILTRDTTAHTTTLTIRSSKDPPLQTQSYAIKNLLLKANLPSDLIAVGQFADGALTSGTLALDSVLRFVLPFLPDPYATNIHYDPRGQQDVGVIGNMTIKLTWDMEHPVTVDLALPPSPLRSLPVKYLPEDDISNLFDPSRIDLTGFADKQNEFNIAEQKGPKLLDLSTNVSQFGVSFPALAEDHTVSGMALQTQAANLRVFALPAVQWEAMVGLDPATGSVDESFSFLYSGPATYIASDSVKLVSIAPRDAIDNVLNGYNASFPPIPVVARFSLPFGIIAIARASRSDVPQPIVMPVQPAFPPPLTGNNRTSLTGGDQISIRVPTPSLTDDIRNTPPLEGAAAYLPGVSNLSVLKPIDDTFNRDFSGNKPKLPVTRVDISGFGESVFSDWRAEVEPGISEVQLDVFTGRTAREVVQMTSIIFPYAIRVVRTITIERMNSGAVVRRDSGWKAASDGEYKFPPPTQPSDTIVTHPGVVRGVTNVTNIRDVKNPKSSLVIFDCSIELEGATAPVPARDQVGYVVLRPGASSNNAGTGPTPTAADYVSVLGSNTLGGPVDAVIDVAGSGFKMRVTSIGVAATAMTNPSGSREFAMAAWGSPIFPGGGQWSFTHHTADDAAPKPIDGNKGVPLVRPGAVGSPPPTAPIPYNFSDPSDILNLDSPRINYSILHAGDSHRLWFQNPSVQLEDLATGLKKGITSRIPPVLADAFALGKSSGIFPPVMSCVPLPPWNPLQPGVFPVPPDPKYTLHLTDANNLLFNPGKLTLDSMRELQKDENFASLVKLSGDLENLSIDTANSAKAWVANLPAVEMITQGAGDAKAEVSRILGGLSSEAGKVTEFLNPQHIFGDALAEVKKVVAFLDSLHILPPFKVSMTNEWSLEISSTMGLEDFFAKIKDHTAGAGAAAEAAMRKILQDFSLSIKSRSTLSTSDTSLKIKVTIKVDSGFGPMALGIAGFDLALGTSGTTMDFSLGVGIGVSFQVGVFGASAYYSQTQTIMANDHGGWGVTATSAIKAHVDILVAQADLFLEATLMLTGGKCPRDGENTIWAWAQVTIALDVSIFWVVNVHVHEQAEWSSRLKGNVCELSEMGAIM